MAEIKIAADSRSEFGKGASRRLRRSGKVPAVLYGHGTDPIHIALPAHETLLALRAANALLSITVDGVNAQLALPKQIQRDPVRGTIEHVDLLLVRQGEKVTVEVPIVLTGEAADDTTVNHDLQTLPLMVEATHIPERVEISIEGLEAGTQIAVKDLTLPEGATFHGDPDTLVFSINVAAELSLEPEPEQPAETATAAGEGAEAE